MGDSRLIMLEDLMVNMSEDSILDSIGVYDTCQHKDMISCKQCSGTDLEEVEVLGAGDRPLFWECQECDAMYLVYSRVRTELMLSKALGTWTDPNAWGRKDKSEFN